MKKTKKQRFSEICVKVHKGALKVSVCGMYMKNVKFFSVGHTTFKRKNKRIFSKYIK